MLTRVAAPAGLATNELSREFDVSEFDGQTVSLRVTATDSAGYVIIGRSVFEVR